MQKNLLFKTVIIIAVLLIFLGGIFGIPSSWTWAGLKQAALDRVHLGLDLKGGTHLILTVKVNEAISSQSDHTIELLKEEMGKARIAYTDVSKPDPENHPERITVQGVSPNDSSPMN